jgi:hypothetical protein
LFGRTGGSAGAQFGEGSTKQQAAGMEKSDAVRECFNFRERVRSEKKRCAVAIDQVIAHESAKIRADLADGVSFSNSPASPETIYGSLFLPWIHPVQLTPGETVRVQLEAKLVGDDYVWRWATQIHGVDPSSGIRDQFEQSTMAGSALSPKRLQKIASDFVPQLSEEGLLDRKILGMMDGHTTLEEIARRLSAEYPERFPNWHAAMKIAGALSQKYSR